MPGARLGRALVGRILDIPAEPGDRDQGGQRDRLRAVAAVEGALASTAVAADQQVLASGAGVADGDPGPVSTSGVLWRRRLRTAACQALP